jgi:Holliday junction resolvase RusA-like endonuclease
VNVLYRFYMPTRRRVDLSNLISAMDDVLVKHRILADDNRDVIAGHDGSRVYHDKDDPRVEVLIQEVTGYKQWRSE